MSDTCVACGEPWTDGRCVQCGVARAPGGYVVERVVAQTAHSRMYLAVSPSGERVALKELVFALVPGTVELEAFHREVSVLRDLRLGGVPRFVASFEEGRGVGTRLYLAQEFVEGATLAERLTSGPLRDAELLGIAREVLEILDGLHSHVPTILHRDVKPANLVQRPDGRIALVDFGAARLLTREITHRATLVGTFGYMPPEQLGGTVDVTSDLYALGATLAHLASGRAPADLAGEGLALDVTKVPGNKRFQTWLGRLVAVDRGARFPSARAALEGLEEVGEVVEEPPAKLSKSLRVATFATGGFLAALGVTFVVLAGFDAPPPPRVQRLEPRSSRVTKAAPAPAVPPEDLAPLEIVSPERVLAPGARTAFWLDAGLEIRPRRSTSWSWDRREELSRKCQESPAEFVTGLTVSLPPNITSGALLRVEFGYYAPECAEVPMSLRSEDGQDMRAIADGSAREWIVLRHVPRYVLTIGTAARRAEVAIDLEARTIGAPKPARVSAAR